MRQRRFKGLLLSVTTAAIMTGCAAKESAPSGTVHTTTDVIPWTTTNRYPEWFRKTYRYKELVGGVSNWQSMAGAWKGIPQPEIRMDTLQLDAGAIYPFHAHPAPELYYVIKGTAEWTVGQETFTASAGTAIYTPPETRHQMINTGKEPLELLFVWWAPGGDTRVLDVASRMLDGWDRTTPSDR